MITRLRMGEYTIPTVHVYFASVNIQHNTSYMYMYVYIVCSMYMYMYMYYTTPCTIIHHPTTPCICVHTVENKCKPRHMQVHVHVHLVHARTVHATCVLH